MCASASRANGLMKMDSSTWIGSMRVAVALLVCLLAGFANGAYGTVVGGRPAVTVPGQEAVLEALVAIDKGDLETANALLDVAVEKFPKTPAVWEALGILRSVEGNYSDAERALRKANELAPNYSGPLTKLAIVKRAEGDRAQAKELLNRALSISPTDYLAHQELARILADEHDASGAIREYRLALRGTLPEVTVLHLEYARYLDRYRQYQDVIDLLEPLVDEPGKDSPEARFLIASAYLEQHRAEPALAHIERLQSLEPGYPGVAVLQAVAMRLQGDYDASASSLRKILADDPANAKVRYQLGLTLAAAGDWRAALTELETAAGGRDDTLAVHLAMAQIRLQHGQTREAIAGLESVVPTTPEPAAYELLAEAYLAANDAAKVVATTDKLVERFPNYLPGHLFRVRMLARIGRNAEAMTAVARLSERFPTAPEVWSARANLLLNSGERQAAMSVLEQGIVRNPGSIPLTFHLAALYQQSGRSTEAERLYRSLLEAHPDHVYSLNNLAVLLSEESNRSAEALSLAERAYALAPTIPEVQKTLGWARHLNGDDQGAVELLSMAASQRPEDPTLSCRLGAAYQGVGNTAGARDALKSCLERSSNPTERRQAQELLERL